MAENKRTRTVANGLTKPSKSRKKSSGSNSEMNLDRFFNFGNDNSSNTIHTNKKNISDDNLDNSSYCSDDPLSKLSQAKKNEIPQSSVDLSSSDSKSNDSKYLLMITEMTETIKFLSEKTKSLSNKIDQSRNRTTLQIDSGNVNDQDLPHLNVFETFKLPIDDHQQLERLECCLKNDKSFNIFFVSL